MTISELGTGIDRRRSILAPLILSGLLAVGCETAMGATWADARSVVRTGRGGGEDEQSRRLDPFLPGVEPPWSPRVQRWIRLASSSEVGLGLEPSVNRVDGFSLLARQTLRARRRSWVPNLTAYEGYGLASERWSGSLETWIHPGAPEWRASARWSDETMPHLLPRQVVNSSEHFLAAGLLREDFLDYWRRDGEGYRIEWRNERDRGVALEWFDERHRSLERTVSKYGPFGGGKRFRPNLPIEEGDFRGWRSRGQWVRTNERLRGPSPMASAAYDVQWVVDAPGGREPFTRVWLEHRAEVRLTPAQGLAYRVAGGFSPEGEADSTGSRLPRQWGFQAGGLSSLRGHPDGAFAGDRLALGTLEYLVYPAPEVRSAIFIDAGMCWNTADDRGAGVFGSGPLALDGGLGLVLGERGPRVDVARDLRKERASARVTLRLTTPY